jgi:hypothetical protein
MEQPSDETGETKWYPNCMQLFPRWSWTLLPLENVDKLCKAFAAKAELVPKYKFGRVEVTKNTRRALEVDKINDNNLWYEAFQREMSQLLDYNFFHMSHSGESMDAYQRIPYHVIPDTKFDSRGKAHLFPRQ